MENKKSNVYISYSHKDEAWKDRLTAHLSVLMNSGQLEIWDDRVIQIGNDWYHNINAAMERASAAILLISSHFLTSDFILEKDVATILHHHENKGMRIFPLIITPCPWSEVDWLNAIQVLPIDGKPLSSMTEHEADEALSIVSMEVLKLLKATTEKPISKPDKISLSRLPVTGDALFGRDEILQQLNEAWETNTTNIVSLVGWGGAGKSALVNHWLRQLAGNNYCSAERVYGWSFYSQGNNNRSVSADSFIHHALSWFGDKDPNEGSPWDKGERLATLVNTHKTLLILDGLEPMLQPSEPERGRIKEPSLQALLRGLATQNAGLCVISTRVIITDLEDFQNSNHIILLLEHLSPRAGGQLLHHQGVIGDAQELEQASREFNGHALALTLLGHYLVNVYAGDIKSLDKLPSLAENERDGGHAYRVMRTYESWLGDGPELSILRLLGLFERPAEIQAITVLRCNPVLPGLTEALQNITDDQWHKALNRLRSIGLLACSKGADDGRLDVHPLVREHFRSWLQRHRPELWQECNVRLFDYYLNIAKEKPDTLEQMTPLFQAMSHGSAAGRFQDVFENIYLARILRNNELYITRKLGAYGADLAALTRFFEQPWFLPVAALSEAAQAFVLNMAGFDLRALGRLAEAVQPMETGLKADIERMDWVKAARNAGNLSELHLTLGNLAHARSRAEQAVDLADQSGDSFQRTSMRTTLADGLFQSGQFDEARVLYQEAEQMQKEKQPSYPLLYSLRGYQYCDLLLQLGDYGKVQERAEMTLEWANQFRFLLDIALDHLSLGRTHLLQAQSKGTKAENEDWQEAAHHLNQAVEGLRQSGSQDHLPRGLLARASLYRLQGLFERAQRDLDETFSIAQQCGMLLFETDAHLEQAWLFLHRREIALAEPHLEQAKKIIEKTGYHRRDNEVVELALELEG